MHLEQVGELVNASAVVYPGGFRFCRGNQPLLLSASSRLIQPSIGLLSGLVDSFIQFLLTNSISLTFPFEPAQDLFQLTRKEFLHRAARWFLREGASLVETLSGWAEQIPKAVACVALFDNVDSAKSAHVMSGNGRHSAKVCLVALWAVVKRISVNPE